MRDYLLGNAPLGHGQGGAVAGPDRHIGPPYYLINDTFTTDRAAGAVNGTDAEPGPGRRNVSDIQSILALSSGAASFGTRSGVLNGDPAIWYGALARAPGRLVRWHASSPFGFTCGWGVTALSSTANDGNAFQIVGSNNVRAYDSSIFATVYTGAVTEFAIALRAAGAVYFAKVSSNWILLWFSTINTAALMIPAIVALNGIPGTFNYMTVRSERWLPVPLVSDGFSAWGTSDGLGHVENSGLGSGGNGEAWTANAGTWEASGGVARASALASGQAIATVDTGTADVLATVNLTHVGGTASVIVRYTDSDNYVRAVHTGTNAQLIKRVGGVETTLINSAATYVAGAELRISCQGTAFRLFYNNNLIGSEQTISDAGLASGTRQGLRTTDTGNTFDDFRVYARGTGGEYAALDDF